MLSRGIYPPPSQFEAWFLSAAHTKKDIDQTIRVAHEAMTCAKSKSRARKFRSVKYLLTSQLLTSNFPKGYRQGIRCSIQLMRVRSL